MYFGTFLIPSESLLRDIPLLLGAAHTSSQFTLSVKKNADRQVTCPWEAVVYEATPRGDHERRSYPVEGKPGKIVVGRKERQGRLTPPPAKNTRDGRAILLTARFVHLRSLLSFSAVSTHSPAMLRHRSVVRVTRHARSAYTSLIQYHC